MKKKMNINVSMRRKQKRKTFVIFACIYSAVLLFIALQIASYQNTVPNSGNFFASFYPAMKALFENPVYIVTYELSGPATFIDIGIAAIIATLTLGLLWYEDVKHLHDLPLGGSGTARWEDDYKGFAKEFTNNNPDENTILSENVWLDIDTRKTQRNDNVLVVGGSGSGKTRYFAKPAILQESTNFVVTDPSGELLESTGKALKDDGFDVKVFNLVEKQKSNCYNPFHYIRDAPGILVMINCLIKNTTPPESHSNDPFWEKSETALLQALCFYLHDYRPESEQNFSTVMKLLNWAKVSEKDEGYESPLDKIFLKSTRGEDDKSFKEYKKKSRFKDLNGNMHYNESALSIEEIDENSIAVKQYKIFKQGAGKTAKSILISCSVRLSVFNLPDVAWLTDEDNIHLEDLGGRIKTKNSNGQDSTDSGVNNKQALFVVIPAADSTFNFLVSMMYSQLFETLYFIAETKCENKRLTRHVRFILDEFANIGTIPEFTKKLATMRKYEISCCVLLQNLAQIKTLYKDDWESIVGNCDSFLFLGGKEYTTLEYISKELGKQTIITRDRSLKTGGGKGGTDTGSYKETARELMMPDELGAMDNKDCVVMIRGLDPFLDKKYSYTEHKRYHLTGDADDNNRYINELDNSKRFKAISSLSAQQHMNDDCKIEKISSFDGLIDSNPEWARYPDVFAQFKLIPGMIYERPAEPETHVEKDVQSSSDTETTPSPEEIFRETNNNSSVGKGVLSHEAARTDGDFFDNEDS